MLVQCAWAASHTKGTYLGVKYRKLASRIGKKKALIALAHTMLVSIYYMIQRKEPYKDLGPNYLDNLHKERTVKNLKKRIEALGLIVELKVKTDLSEDTIISEEQNKDAPLIKDEAMQRV